MKANSLETNRKFWLSAAIGLALLVMAATPRTARAQWLSPSPNPNNNIYYNAGNVGIGTTSPSDLFHLSRSANTNIRLTHSDSTSSSNGVFFYEGGTLWGFMNQRGSSFTSFGELGGQFNLGNANASGALQLVAGGAPRLQILSGGNVGIGTTSPVSKLHLQVTSTNTTTGPLAAADIGLFISNSDTTANNIAAISFGNSAPGNQAQIGVVNIGSTLTAGGHLFFNTRAAGGGLAERMRIDSSGNVGIGTTTPLARLDVRTGTVALPPGGGLDPNTYHTWLPFSDGKNYIRGTTIIADQGGSVGIGAAPNYKLDVAGDIRSTTGFRFQDNSFQTTAATMTGVTAGEGLTGGGTSGTVTLTNTDKGSTQNIFKNVANGTGTTQFSAGSNSDAVRFAGSGGTSVTFDAATKKVTIDATASTGSAGNIAAGQFGQNTGGGNYTFPGNVTVNGNIAAKYQDMAEWVPSSEQLPTGTVVVLDSTKSNQVIASTRAYDTRVAGVISEQPGISLGESGAGKVLVATTGRVLVQVNASKSPIHIGDLLVTSDVPGVAMKSEPVNLGGVQLHRPGTLIGKALEPLEKGRGKILVLLSLQ